jgi:hypothetical protein
MKLGCSAGFLALAAIGAFGGLRTLRAEDCNANGISDDLDLRPPFVGAQPVHLGDGSEFNRVAAADFDGDGIDDLVTSGLNTGKVLLHSAMGDGTFRSSRELAFSGKDAVPTALDLEPDGDSDLLVFDYLGESITLLVNEGGPGFSPMPGPVPDQGYNLIGAADLDADGDADFAAAGVDSRSIRVFTGDGTGAFTGTQKLELGNRSPVLMVVVDADSDGDRDVLTANVGGLTGVDAPSVAVFRNEGGGRLSPAIHYPAGVEVGPRATGDFDGDGDPDFIMASVGFQPRFAFLPNTGRGEFPSLIDLPAPWRLSDLRGVDTEGDGDLDLAVLPGGPMLILENGGSARFEEAASYVLRGSSAATGDFNHDGSSDIVLANGPQVVFNRGDGSFRATGFIPIEGGSRRIAAADLDADGDTDLVANGLKRVLVAVNVGNGTFGPAESHPLPGDPGSLIVADLDGDGDSDLVTNLPTGVWVAWNGGAGVLGEFRMLDIPGLVNVVAVTVADVDADASLDVLLHFGIDLSLARNSGSGTFTRPEPLLSVPAPPVPADMDGDAVADLVTFSNRERRVLLFTNDGSGTFSEASNVPIAGIPTALILADIDGDASADVITIDETSLTFLRNLKGSLGEVRRVDTMSRPEAVAAGDLNDDGHTDVAVIHTRSENNSVLVGRGDGTFEDRPLGRDLLSTSDFLATGDLDRDGKAELLSASFNGISIIHNESLPPASLDCNGNMVPDDCDVASGASADKDGDGVPDECSAPTLFHRGDPSDDGEIDITDAILLLAHLFRGGAAPGCLEAADADDDGGLNLTDAVFILDFLYLGGPPPPHPGPTTDPCGAGSGPLPCETYSSCRT